MQKVNTNLGILITKFKGVEMKVIIGIVLYLFFGAGAVISGTRWLGHLDDKEQRDEN